ncbi:hypothetical protein [Streptomyces cyaneogriseus]|uniref:hypothetical protein n=1 Tax=Streptomyces cyaneogriseus TaxID=68192 RepID=UPI0013314C50|nr:hypothetical protein [Streptomyces cyaneogriseus]
MARQHRASRRSTDSAPFRGRTPPGTARPTPRITSYNVCYTKLLRDTPRHGPPHPSYNFV